MDAPLPPELARRWGRLRFIRQRGRGEWSAECPKCSDLGHDGRDWPDRFRMWTGPARAWCRRCGYQDFADSDQRGFKVSEEQREGWVEERKKREEEEKRKAEHALELLRREERWLRWHEQMGEIGKQWWEAKGVPTWAVTYYRLGWCPERRIFNGTDWFTTPTATIPVWAEHWQLVNLRHRLVSPPPSVGKYRPDRSGLPSSLFLTNPDEPLAGRDAVLVEGEIKAIVVFSHVCDEGLQVVGTPGKSFRHNLLDGLQDCGRVWVVFDPDAKRDAWQAAQHIGEQARVVYLPVKPDDAFTTYGADAGTFRQALEYGRAA